MDVKAANVLVDADGERIEKREPYMRIVYYASPIQLIIIVTDKERLFSHEFPAPFPNHSQNTQVVANLRILVLASFTICRNG